jgi:hypothetical protein
MNSIDARLSTDERVIYRGRCHWAILLGPILVVIIGGLALRSQGYHAMALIAFGLLWGISSYMAFGRLEIGLTRNRILIEAGSPMKKPYDVPLKEVATIDYYQPALGSMLNFGKIIIVDKGKKKSVVRFVSGPAEFVMKAREEIGTLKSSSPEVP